MSVHQLLDEFLFFWLRHCAVPFSPDVDMETVTTVLEDNTQAGQVLHLKDTESSTGIRKDKQLKFDFLLFFHVAVKKFSVGSWLNLDHAILYRHEQIVVFCVFVELWYVVDSPNVVELQSFSALGHHF